MELSKISLSKVLFVDIETVSASSSYQDLSSRMQELWKKKARFLARQEEDTPEALYEKAGIYAEFGKIIVISVGFFRNDELRLTSFYGEDEKELLTDFATLISRHFNTVDHYLCAHNGKEFDFPYIARRMLIQGVALPDMLNTPGKKPWEVKHLDTLELWKFGDYKHYTSLDLLTAIFDIPTPKEDINGSEVGGIYWEEKDVERIKRYCEKDVLALARLFQRFRNLPIVQDAKVQFVGS